MKKSKITWRTEQWRLDKLIPNPSNPRKITNKQMDDLTANIDTLGYAELIAINLNGDLLAGHRRRESLLKLNSPNTLIDVRVPSRLLTKQEAQRYLIASNALGGTWDIEKLEAIDPQLLLDIGMDENIVAEIWDSQLEVEDDGWDEEKEIAKIKKPKSKVGEIYQLGPHRLAVGDSTDPSVLKKLFGTEQALMIYSDPVYNLSVDYNRGLGGRQSYGGEVNDKRTKSEYREFLKKSIEAALLVAKPDTHIFYWNDEAQIALVQDLFEELKLTNRRVCLWIKNGMNVTPGVAFSKCFEPCIYSTRGRPYLTKGIQNLNEVLNKNLGTGNALIDDILDQLNIWLVKRLPSTEYKHATSKPPSLHEKAIRRCTRPGDIILDSFSGSGSTLVAAHQLKRRAFMVELEPLFADLAITRFEKISNEKAKLIN
jgi:site-specific DNA-methyltransferase (adenine-specific)